MQCVHCIQQYSRYRYNAQSNHALRMLFLELAQSLRGRGVAKTRELPLHVLAQRVASRGEVIKRQKNVYNKNDENQTEKH